MSRIYLAGAISCYDKNNDYPYRWRREFSNELSNKEFFNPTLYYSLNEKNQKTEKEVFRYELNELKMCDLVAVNLNDIDKSTGTICELMCAYENGIPVVGFIDKDKDKLHPWIEEICMRIEDGENAMYDLEEYIRWYY